MDLIVFENEVLGSIRAMNINNEPWFIGKDITNILGYRNGSRDINRHIDIEDKTKSMLYDGNQLKETIIINESGLYSLILSSKLPQAKEFKRWVTKEVLISIRQNGGYIENQKQLTEDEIMAKAVLIAKKIVENQANQISEMQSKIDFFDTVTESTDTFDMLTVSKILNFKGVGRNKLFVILRDESILNASNEPYQKYIDNGWFRVIESRFIKLNGDICINSKTVVYQKGIDGILRILQRRYNV